MSLENENQETQPIFNGGEDGETLIYGTPNATHLTAAELRTLLGLPSGEHIQDYGDISTIGIGGVGAVFSAREPGLNREIALKLLRPQYRDQAERIEGFIREARATAQIDHPNIVPVHRLGVFDDVGVYFTMKRVEGETLRAVLRKLAENRPGYRRKFSLIRLLEIFLGACHGVAFAHRHGILHGDLKPGNLMVGDYGEVMVMDWGMARYRPELDQGGANAKMDLELNMPLQESEKDGKTRPKLGGTPAFMAPEQLTGKYPEPTEQTDIYALGAILYTILTWQGAPFNLEMNAEEIMRAAALGNFPPPRKAAHRGQPVPLELEAICLKAMNRNRERRYTKVADLIADVRNYLDGYPVAAYSPGWLYHLMKLIRRRPLVPSALAAALLTWLGFYGFTYINNLSESNSLLNLAEYSYSQARANHAEARRIFRLLQTPDGAAERGRKLEAELIAQTAEMQNGFNAALELISRTTEHGRREAAVDRMIRDIFRLQLEFYLSTGNYDALKNVLRQGRSQWQALFVRALNLDPELTTLVAKISSKNGTLRLTSSARDKLRLTILQPDGTPATDLNTDAALEDRELNSQEDFVLPGGDYQLRVTRGDGRTLTFPIRVPLAGVEDVHLELPEKLPHNAVFIPAGSFTYSRNDGRNGNVRFPLPAYLIGKYEVTFGEYLEFWRSLPEDSAEREEFRAWCAFDPASGRRDPVWDDDGELRAPFSPTLPVVGITPEAAEAYCRWFGKRFGFTGRLPTRVEWQKAARGVDARAYVWGDEYQTGRALLGDHPDRTKYPAGAEPGSFPRDRSPYGVCDLSGNVREMVEESADDTSFHSICGGSYLTTPRMAECGSASYGGDRARDVGFRYLLELPDEEEPQQSAPVR